MYTTNRNIDIETENLYFSGKAKFISKPYTNRYNVVNRSGSVEQRTVQTKKLKSKGNYSKSWNHGRVLQMSERLLQNIVKGLQIENND